MVLFDLNSLNKLPFHEQIKIKKETINSFDLNMIPIQYLPDVVTDNYFFISYSHLDYRLVYSDIFDLQEHGLSIWYDRGMPVGKDWRDTANKYLTPYACKAVIFYISENALLSNAVRNEIEFTKNANKPFLTIFIPSKENENLWQLIDRLHKEDKIDEDKYNFYLESFPKEVICLSINDEVTVKVDKLLNSLPSQPLLAIDLIDSCYEGDGQFVIDIRALNDYYAKKISINDFIDACKNPLLIEERNNLFGDEEHKEDLSVLDNLTINNISQLSINDSAFSNMIRLETVELPPVFNIKIGQFAFYNCENLTEVITNADDKSLTWQCITLGEYAFSRCMNLKHFDFNGISLSKGAFSFSGLIEADLTKCLSNEIPEEAFYYSKLERVVFSYSSASIKSMAFAFTNIKELVLPENMVAIEKLAFTNCEKLESIKFNLLIKSIGVSAFSGCSSLKEIHLPSSLEEIEQEAFADCDKLTKIYYEYTSEQLKKICHPKWLGYHQKDIEVICKDKVLVFSKKDIDDYILED